MIVEFKIKTSVFRAVLECAKWQAGHNAMVHWTHYQEDGRTRMCSVGNYQPDQWVEVTDDGHLRYDGRRHALWQDGGGCVIHALCTEKGVPMTRRSEWFRDVSVTDYDTADDRLMWWETADDHDWAERWAQYAADTLHCESGGSRSRRHG